MANHLAGAVAAHTILPVIGVPLGGSALQGVDALYSTVQMPAGVPVATVAIGSAGAKNAGVLAAQILALGDHALQLKLEDLKERLARGERL
jgi:5-(carboxyamino)imidazole ribonucleotide mutase